MKFKVVAFLCVFSSSLLASEASRIRAWDIGVMGLASHDLFRNDYRTNQNLENGRLDLSTLFDESTSRSVMKQGGNRKNASNPLVYNIAMRLVEFYELKEQELMTSEDSIGSELDFSNSASKKARLATVQKFHQWVAASYKAVLKGKFPKTGINAEVTNVEQSLMRAIHDVLPHYIYLSHEPKELLDVTDFRKARTYLKDEQLQQSIPFYDGMYADGYYAVRVPSGRGQIKVINLYEEDKRFVERSGIGFSFDAMLQELGLLSIGDSVVTQTSFGYHFEELFSKGICFLEGEEENIWIPQTIACD